MKASSVMNKLFLKPSVQLQLRLQRETYRWLFLIEQTGRLVEEG